jgi:hypothetical protein
MEIVIASMFIGGAFGFFAAVLMMGTKVAEANDIIFQQEVKRRMELAKLVVDEEPPAPQKKTKNSQKKHNQ